MNPTARDDLMAGTSLVVLLVAGWSAFDFLSMPASFDDHVVARPVAPTSPISPISPIVPRTAASERPIEPDAIERAIAQTVAESSPPASPFTLVSVSANDTRVEATAVRRGTVGDPEPFPADRFGSGRFGESISMRASASTGVSGGGARDGGEDESRAAETESEDPNLLSIGGRVVSGDGRPVPGHRLSGERTGAVRGTVRTAITDAEGRFSISGLERGEYLLRTQVHPFYATRVLRVRAGSRTVDIDLPLLDTASIEGLVTDEYGQPVANARVIPPLADEKTHTDERGEYSASVTATAGRSLSLRFEAPGYLSELLHFPGADWSPEEPLRTEVRLRQGRFGISGTVFDEQGYPVVEALVQITSGQSRLHLHTQTDGQGRFAMEQVLPASDYRLKVSSTARYEAFEVEGFPVEQGMGDIQVELGFAPLGTMTGRIMGPTGEPVAALSLLVTSDAESGRAATISSDDDGEFVLEDFVAGGLSLRSRTAPDILIQNLRLDAGSYLTRDLVVDLGEYSLFGMVTGPDGFPLEGVELRMKHDRVDASGYKSTTTRSVVSDGEGSFRFTGLGGGERSVRAIAASHDSGTLTFDPLMDEGPHAIALAR